MTDRRDSYFEMLAERANADTPAPSYEEWIRQQQAQEITPDDLRFVAGELEARVLDPLTGRMHREKVVVS